MLKTHQPAEELSSDSMKDTHFIELNAATFAPVRNAQPAGIQETSRHIHEWISRIHSRRFAGQPKGRSATAGN